MTIRPGPARRGRAAFVARERLAHCAYFLDWPARLWALAPASARVAAARHEVAALAPGSPRLRIAFISDIHIGPTTARRTLDAAFALVAGAEPDVFALGGDLLFGRATCARLAELTRRVAAVPAPVKIAVHGNHDHWTDPRAIESALRAAGARLLLNDALRLSAPHSDVAILGIDDPLTGLPDPEAALAACGDAPVRLAIAHAPEALPMLAPGGVSLLLCGHTHGGHIALPGPRPLYIPGPVGRTHPFGRFEEDGLTLIVSRGVGAVGVPLRWNAPPDVLVVDVVARPAAVANER